MIIILMLCMLAAIRFNNQSLFKADKINDIFPYGGLSSKFAAKQLSVSNLPPESLFSIC